MASINQQHPAGSLDINSIFAKVQQQQPALTLETKHETSDNKEVLLSTKDTTSQVKYVYHFKLPLGGGRTKRNCGGYYITNEKEEVAKQQLIKRMGPLVSFRRASQ